MRTPLAPTYIIEPVQERLTYDIAIPITKPRLEYNIRKLSELDVTGLKPVFEQEELAEVLRVKLKVGFAMTETESFRPPRNCWAPSQTRPLTGPKLPNRFRRAVSRRARLRRHPLRSRVLRAVRKPANPPWVGAPALRAGQPGAPHAGGL
jgi:hypothetical protein